MFLRVSLRFYKIYIANSIKTLARILQSIIIDIAYTARPRKRGDLQSILLDCCVQIVKCSASVRSSQRTFCISRYMDQ
jgi:hypothetical protein